jgi:hypothetical protein
MNIKRHLLILLLAIWLPSHSLAGALLHCQLMEHSEEHMGDTRLADAETIETHGSHPAQISQAQFQEMSAGDSLSDCHGQTGMLSSPDPALESVTPPDAQTQCQHCNGTCHGIQQLTTHLNAVALISTIKTFSPSSSAAEKSSIPENPQRPPKHS